MPVTRSSSRQASRQPTLPFSPRRGGSSGNESAKKAAKAPSNRMIIVLSSDDDEPPSKGTSSKKQMNRSTKKRAVATPRVYSDVLEISSDEETPKKLSTRKQTQSSLESTNKDLQRTVKKLQEELKRKSQLLASTSRQVEELKRDFPNKDVLSGMGEHIACEVCTHTMWCPYTLPECGHSFCEDCLVEWFGTTQAQHMMANPQLAGNRAALAGQLQRLIPMIPNLHQYGVHGQTHVRAVLAELRRHRPEYTCPSCRKEVLNKPVQDFRLMGLVKEIAELMGETSPDKGRWGSGPFDHFFAAPTS